MVATIVSMEVGPALFLTSYHCPQHSGFIDWMLKFRVSF